MNSRTTRMRKEARALFWPWCAVTLAGVLPIVLHESHSGVHGIVYVTYREMIGRAGFFGGIALLATLSLGNEFQHRTISLLLSQPVGRMQIWGEKLSVTVVAVLSAALAFYYGWRSVFQQDPWFWVFAGTYVITTMSSATFWTLLARSTMGGLTLNSFPQFFIILAWANWEWILGPKPSPVETITVLSIVALAGLFYAGVMLWLGGRKLARFQVTGGMAGNDLLMAGPYVMPEALAGLFRCRPTGPFLNLIRKELCLLRPLWLITLLVVLCWTCLTMFGFVPERGSTKDAPLAAVMVSLLSIVVAILAGCLSLGEERTSGTQSWHMTLPVSARRQWLIKLVMAMFTGFVCAVLLPVLVVVAAGSLLGSPFMFVAPRWGILWTPTLLLLSFVSFWCACAVNGTVRAALWVFPAMGTIFIASRFGDWVAGKLAQATGTLMDFVVTWFHLSPLAFPSIHLAVPAALGLVVPLFALIQSYRLFRTQPQDGILWVIRCLLPLAIVAFLCRFSVSAFGFGAASR